MKVAYLVNCYSKISHTFIRREVRALEAHGQPIERFSLRPPDAELVDEADIAEARQTYVILQAGSLRILGSVLRACSTSPARFVAASRLAIKLGRLSRRGVRRNFAYLVEACELLHCCNERGVDHVHAHFGTNSTTVALLCHALGGPGYSFTVHGPEEFDSPLPIGLRDKIAHARFVIAISSYGRSQLFRYCDYAHWSKVHIVRCGLDASFLERDSTPVPASGSLLCIGRLSEQKGHTVLVEAFAQVAKQRPAAELVLVGDGELRAEIEAQIAQHGLGGRIHLRGWADNARVQEELGASRALVMASFAEGLPVVIMEALALGRPVVTTDVAGIPELVTEGCGFLATPGSSDSLARAMLRVLDADHDLLQVLGDTGRTRARALHDARIEAAHLLSLFRSYASNEANPRSSISPDRSL